MSKYADSLRQGLREGGLPPAIRAKYERALAAEERRIALQEVRREEIAALPFKVSVRKAARDHMGSWTEYAVWTNTAPGGKWEKIGTFYSTAQGWSASYREQALLSGWHAAETRHEALMAITHAHQPKPQPPVQRSTRPAPVTDHEAEGDGTADPTWCWCGRAFSEHLRRPRP